MSTATCPSRRSLLRAILGSLAVASVLHGFYNFAVIGLPGFGLPLAAALITALWLWRLLLIRDLHEEYQRGDRIC